MDAIGDVKTILRDVLWGEVYSIRGVETRVSVCESGEYFIPRYEVIMGSVDGSRETSFGSFSYQEDASRCFNSICHVLERQWLVL